MSNSVTDWSFTDQVHDDAGGAGITWQCPDCRQSLTYAHGAWWDLECSCVGRDWNLSVSVTWEDPGSVPDDEPPELSDVTWPSPANVKARGMFIDGECVLLAQPESLEPPELW